MIKGVSITNFKAIGDPGVALELKPIKICLAASDGEAGRGPAVPE